MNLERVITWVGGIALAIILVDEVGYYFWKQLYRGEHWSHIRERTGLQNWNEDVPPAMPTQLNRSWSGRF